MFRRRGAKRNVTRAKAKYVLCSILIFLSNSVFRIFEIFCIQFLCSFSISLNQDEQNRRLQCAQHGHPCATHNGLPGAPPSDRHLPRADDQDRHRSTRQYSALCGRTLDAYRGASADHPDNGAGSADIRWGDLCVSLFCFLFRYFLIKDSREFSQKYSKMYKCPVVEYTRKVLFSPYFNNDNLNVNCCEARRQGHQTNSIRLSALCQTPWIGR